MNVVSLCDVGLPWNSYGMSHRNSRNVAADFGLADVCWFVQIFRGHRTCYTDSTRQHPDKTTPPLDSVVELLVLIPTYGKGTE